MLDVTEPRLVTYRPGSVDAVAAAAGRLLDPRGSPPGVGDIEVLARGHDFVDAVEDVSVEDDLRRLEQGGQLVHGARPDDGRSDGRVVEGEDHGQLGQAHARFFGQVVQIVDGG